MSTPTILHLQGPSSSGKTTLARRLQEDLDDLYLYLSVDSFAETIWRWYGFPTLDEVNAAGVRGDYLRVFTNGSAIISNARSSVWPKQGTMSSSTPSIWRACKIGHGCYARSRRT